jgi:hypothetical protein
MLPAARPIAIHRAMRSELFRWRPRSGACEAAQNSGPKRGEGGRTSSLAGPAAMTKRAKMKARGTSRSEPPVRPAALALRTKVIADRARSGDREGVAIASGTPPEARTATFGDTNNESAIGRPHNRNRSVNGSGRAKGDHDAKQSFDVHAFLPLDPRHAACCRGSQSTFPRAPSQSSEAQFAMLASLLEPRAETWTACQGAGLNPRAGRTSAGETPGSSPLARGAPPDDTHVKGVEPRVAMTLLVRSKGGKPSLQLSAFAPPSAWASE